MGLKLTKPEPCQVDCGKLVHVQNHLINYVSRSFFIRNLVSKKRRRMIVGGYDLDMTYITDRILAMSFPAERMRSVYRNPLWQVKSVLDMRHPGHYKVYNLCIEESYNPSHFHGCVERFPFDDNHVPPLPMIKEFCEDVDSWLSSDPKNIAVVHCMAGKGRTGLMVSSYLVYAGMRSEKALQVYAEKRTTNNEGVSIPSQRRYVAYWEETLSFPKGDFRGIPDVNLPIPVSRELRRIRLYDTNNVQSVVYVVAELQNYHLKANFKQIPGQRYHFPAEVSRGRCRQIKKGFQQTDSPRYYYSFIEKDEEEKKADLQTPRLVVQMDTERSILDQKTCLDYYYEKPLQVTGDVRIIFYEKQIGGRLFYACFNTAFIRSSILQLSIQDMDKVGKKGRSICGSAFCLELLFDPINANFLLPPPSSDIDP